MKRYTTSKLLQGAITQFVAIALSYRKDFMNRCEQWPVMLMSHDNMYMLVCPFCGKILVSHHHVKGEGTATITDDLVNQVLDLNPWEDDNRMTSPMCECTHVISWTADYRLPTRYCTGEMK